MKKIYMFSLMAGVLLCSGMVRAEEQKAAAVVPAAEAVVPIEVGNKICPVSGEKIGGMGKAVKKEYNGKIYSMCCGMCPKDFDKDPAKYAKIAEDEVAATAAAVVSAVKK